MGSNVAPNVVTDGLVLCLDGANLYSYPTSGILWSDLTANRNNFTLINGPTYDSSNGGNLLFDGVNDYANISYNSTLSSVSGITLESWFYPVGRGTNAIFDGAGTLMRAGQVEDMQYSLNYVWDFNSLSFGTFRSNNGNPYPSAGSFYYYGTPNNVVYRNRWNLATVTRLNNDVKIYANGQLVLSLNNVPISSNTYWITYAGGSLTLGRSMNPYINYYGKIAVSRIYNRPLTDSEVLQNFNAHKGRFNL